MRPCPLILTVFLALAAVLATPAPEAGSGPVVPNAASVSRAAATPQPAASAGGAGHSVRRKVSPVTYGGPQGRPLASPAASAEPQRVAPSASRLSAAVGGSVHVPSLRLSPAPKTSAPRPVALSAPALPDRPGDVTVAARGCARRLLALAERGILGSRPATAAV